jgi:hypothetical protein
MLMSDGELIYPDFSRSLFQSRINLSIFHLEGTNEWTLIHAFLHEKLTHVFQIYDFAEIKTITKPWEEMGQFIKDLEESNEIIKKAEQAHRDGSQEVIAEEDYITGSNIRYLIIVATTDESKYRELNKTIRGVRQEESRPPIYSSQGLEI